ncbi:MAG: 8-amino-7-oxononanoate synthase [Acidithiobacillus sp.]|uniref:aminotransferase class I/II-fold pyridoxal phosphate-dependent enzyme n=1 Tax=Acidithiobacillus sp. TaxID=1872118 RepID=UPI00338F2FFA|nr:8-amino-7-oxononanoate synthase [Acidithiobacillus sp.]
MENDNNLEELWQESLAQWTAQGRERRLEVLIPLPGQRPLFRDAEGKTLLSFASNDYLGLSHHPALTLAAQRVLQRGEASSAAAPLLGGERNLHHILAEELARWLGVEAVLLFGSGYLANLGILQTLVGPKDLILLDRLAHASLIDGARLSGARIQRYRHNDMEHLAKLLAAPRKGRAWIVTEGVFSMDGDLAPLPELCTLARQQGAGLLLDEAHALGVLGATGRGSVEHWGLSTDAVPVRMGTLGKAFGSYGAFVAGSRSLIQWLTQRARSFVFHTALPASQAACSLAALAILRDAAPRRRHLDLLRQQLQALKVRGHWLPSSTPIQGLLLGSNERALAAARILREHGIYCPAIRPPTVPEGSARLRISLSAAHRFPDLQLLGKALLAL